jgi:hypothetical protein
MNRKQAKRVVNGKSDNTRLSNKGQVFASRTSETGKRAKDTLRGTTRQRKEEKLLQIYRVKYWELNELQLIGTVGALEMAERYQAELEKISKQLGYVPGC